MCNAALPSGLNKNESLVILILNIFLPGIGTIMAAILAPESEGGTVCVGIVQAISSLILVGWIWAICWSLQLAKLVKREEQGKSQAKPSGKTSSKPTASAPAPSGGSMEPAAQPAAYPAAPPPQQYAPPTGASVPPPAPPQPAYSLYPAPQAGSAPPPPPPPPPQAPPS